ncbi:MAG: hypothetical protein ACKOUM_02720, partial [Sphingopyxis sp.]
MWPLVAASVAVGLLTIPIAAQAQDGAAGGAAAMGAPAFDTPATPTLAATGDDSAIDPDAPLAPMDDLGVDWPDMAQPLPALPPLPPLPDSQWADGGAADGGTGDVETATATPAPAIGPAVDSAVDTA